MNRKSSIANVIPFIFVPAVFIVCTVHAVNVESVTDQGQDAWKVTTESATYYFHKQGAGFSSIEDVDGNDWISYQPCCHQGGEYRGIPNLGPCCHPGYSGDNGSSTSVTEETPTKVVISSQGTGSGSTGMQTTWTFYESFAQMVLVAANKNYYMLYEGTPGGTVDAGEEMVLSDGTHKNIGQAHAASRWEYDISPEWAYFPEKNQDRSLVMMHHNDDNLSESYWTMENSGEGNMTVWGFGRLESGATRLMTAAPDTLTIALMETRAHATVGEFCSKVLSGEIYQTSVRRSSSDRLDGNSAGCVTVSSASRGIVIELSPPTGTEIDCQLLDLSGRSVLFPGRSSAGKWVVGHEMLGPGIYILSMEGDKGSTRRKMVLCEP